MVNQSHQHQQPIHLRLDPPLPCHFPHPFHPQLNHPDCPLTQFPISPPANDQCMDALHVFNAGLSTDVTITVCHFRSYIRRNIIIGQTIYFSINRNKLCFSLSTINVIRKKRTPICPVTDYKISTSPAHLGMIVVILNWNIRYYGYW